MKYINSILKETDFPDKEFNIPIWFFSEFIFSIPFSLVFLSFGILNISDGLFDTNFTEPNLGLWGVLIGIVCIFPSVYIVHRIIKYPGITFTKDYVIMPPLRFFHWHTRIIYYDQIKEISFGSHKYDYRILCYNKKWITFPMHNSKLKLWDEFNKELCKRHIQSLISKGKIKQAERLFKSYEWVFLREEHSLFHYYM